MWIMSRIIYHFESFKCRFLENQMLLKTLYKILFSCENGSDFSGEWKEHEGLKFKISTSSSKASLRDSWDAMTPPDDEVLAQTCGARGAPIVSRDLCSLIQKFKNCKMFFFSIQMLERASTRFSQKTKTRAGDEAWGVGSFILFSEGGYQSCRIELLHNARVKTCPKLRRGKNSKDL